MAATIKRTAGKLVMVGGFAACRRFRGEAVPQGGGGIVMAAPVSTKRLAPGPFPLSAGRAPILKRQETAANAARRKELHRQVWLVIMEGRITLED